MKRALLSLFLLILVGAAVAKFWIVELPTVTGNDMAPALQAGDLLLAYRLNTTPERGQLVLLRHPGEERLLVRRVIAVPGDRVAVRKEVPIVNGQPASRTVQREVTLSDLMDGSRKEAKMKLVEESSGGRRYLVLKDPRRRSKDCAEQKISGYFVLSDNRNHGQDSRNFGPVPADRIRAVITHRLSAGPGSLLGEGPREGWTRLR